MQRNIPNLDIDPRATAEEYYVKALEKGYELKDGAYQLSHRSLADRIKSHIPSHRESLRESLYNSVGNADVAGSAKQYFDRAAGVGSELRHGAEQLYDHARTGVPRAINEAQHNYHEAGAVPTNNNLHPTRTTEPAVPLSETHQQPIDEVQRQTLAQQIKNKLPGHGTAHHAKKEAEYAAHRTVHEAEAAAHRAEEAAKYAKDNIERKL